MLHGFAVDVPYGIKEGRNLQNSSVADFGEDNGLKIN